MLCQLRFHCLDDDLNYHYCQMFKILIPPGESKFHDIPKEKTFTSYAAAKQGHGTCENVRGDFLKLQK